MSKGPSKQQLNHAIDILNQNGIDVYTGPYELKTTRHIYRVKGYVSEGKSQPQMKDLVMRLANYYEANPTRSKTTREYHYHDEARERARLQHQEKLLKSGYKRPYLPTVRQTVQRISKNGTKYTVTEDVQQRDLEKEFRSAQRAYNKASNLFEKNWNRYYDMVKEFSKPGSSMTAEQRKEMKDLENWLDENQALASMGKARSKRLREKYEQGGATAAGKYIRELKARAAGKSTRETMQDVQTIFDLIDSRTWLVDDSDFLSACSAFWDNHLDGMTYRYKEEMVSLLKPFASPAMDPISQSDLNICTTIVRQYIGVK